MTPIERSALIRELDELLGPPNGQPIFVTRRQLDRVREIQEVLKREGEGTPA